MDKRLLESGLRHLEFMALETNISPDKDSEAEIIWKWLAGAACAGSVVNNRPYFQTEARVATAMAEAGDQSSKGKRLLADKLIEHSGVGNNHPVFLSAFRAVVYRCASDLDWTVQQFSRDYDNDLNLDSDLVKQLTSKH